jgi:hypothetical protein
MGDNEIESTEAVEMQKLHEDRSCGEGLSDAMAPDGDVKRASSYTFFLIFP